VQQNSASAQPDSGATKIRSDQRFGTRVLRSGAKMLPSNKWAAT
jgi:hypothetical protein